MCLIHSTFHIKIIYQTITWLFLETINFRTQFRNVNALINVQYANHWSKITSMNKCYLYWLILSLKNYCNNIWSFLCVHKFATQITDDIILKLIIFLYIFNNLENKTSMKINFYMLLTDVTKKWTEIRELILLNWICLRKINESKKSAKVVSAHELWNKTKHSHGSIKFCYLLGYKKSI